MQGQYHPDKKRFVLYGLRQGEHHNLVLASYAYGAGGQPTVDAIMADEFEGGEPDGRGGVAAGSTLSTRVKGSLE